MSLAHFYYEPFDRLFDDTLHACKVIPRTGLDTFRPRLDLHESEDSNTVTATFELPGLRSEDVTIDVLNNRLTVSGASGTSSTHEESGYTVRERRYGKFSRTLQLPSGTKPQDATAKMENGLLTVTFPKTNPEQQPKRVAIQ